MPVLADRSHGVSLARPADDLLHHVMGAGGGRGTVFSAQRTQPGVGGPAVTQRLRGTAAVRRPVSCPYLRVDI